MNIDRAWEIACHTEKYSDLDYRDHPYMVSMYSHLAKCTEHAKAGDPVAQMIMAKFVELRLQGDGDD